MARLPDRVVGDAYRNGIAWETLVELVDVENRMAGQDGEGRSADIVASTFEDVGLSAVSVDEFEIPGWWRGSSTLELPESDRQYGHQHQLIALPGTPAGDKTAELVDVGHGTPSEFEAADIDGKIAMASSKTPEDHDRWIHRREKYDAAIEGGAVGFVFRNHVEGCLPPTGGIQDEDGPGEIPGVGVSRELGHRLVRHCETDTVQARLSVDCRTSPTTSQNVSGRVGPATDERVLVTAHHDAHDIAEGAADNGTGSALVAEVGRLLSQVETDLDVGVDCVTFGAEEMGLRGSDHAARERSLEDVRAVVNLDGIGGSRQLSVSTHGFEELSSVFEGVSEEFETPIDVDDGIVPHSDHWPFVREGVPGLMAASTSDSDGRGWGHTHADTLDKLDSRDLRELAVLLAAAVFDLAQADRTVDHVDHETIVDRAHEEGIDIE